MLRRLLDHFASDLLQPLVEFDMPLSDVYQDHWSVTGRNVPDAATPDEAVYLPVRSWCCW